MLKLETLWPSRKFRHHEGYMLTVNPEVHIFMMPIRHNGVLHRVDFTVLMGQHRKEVNNLMYPIPVSDRLTDREHLQKAAAWAMKDTLAWLKDVQGRMDAAVNDMEIVFGQYMEYPGFNDGSQKTAN